MRLISFASVPTLQSQLLTHLFAANRRASGSHYTLGFLSAIAPSIIDDDVPELCPQTRRTQKPPSSSSFNCPIDRDTTHHGHNMASAVRSSLLRQTAALAAPASRSMAPSTRAGPSLLSSVARKQLLRPTFKPSVTQITAFHATSRRNLLPPGPRMSTILRCTLYALRCEQSC